jgi:hypothetical protein
MSRAELHGRTISNSKNNYGFSKFKLIMDKIQDLVFHVWGAGGLLNFVINSISPSMERDCTE